MGFRFRKSFGAGPFRVNLSKSGIGYSVGTKGLRYTKKAGGGTRTTASIPGTGVSYVQESGSTRKRSTSNQRRSSHRYLRQPQGIALSTVVLAWVLGMFGAHKFQQKKMGMGILYLVTLGLFCIGWLGDAITLTMQYNAQKSGSTVPPWKKGSVYIVIGLCVFLLGSCGNNPSETLPMETTAPVIETTQPVTVATETATISTQPTTVATEVATTSTQPAATSASSDGGSQSISGGYVGGDSQSAPASTSPVDEPVQVETTVKATESPAPQEPAADPVYISGSSETMVWIPTKGGTKYHTNSSCSNMDGPAYVSLSEATARGFTPCKRCH